MAAQDEYLENLMIDFYKTEHARKENIYSSTSVPIACLAFIIGALSYIGTNLPPFAHHWKPALAYGFYIIAIALFVWAMIDLYRMIHDNQYGYIPSANQINHYATGMRKYYRGIHARNIGSAITNDLRQLMIRECAEKATFNQAQNNRRLTLRINIFRRMFYSIVFVAIDLAWMSFPKIKIL